MLLKIIVFQQDAFSRSKRESDGVTYVPIKDNSKRVLTDAQEEHVAKYAIKIAKMFHGLTRVQLKKLAYR